MELQRERQLRDPLFRTSQVWGPEYLIGQPEGVRSLIAEFQKARVTIIQ